MTTSSQPPTITIESGTQLYRVIKREFDQHEKRRYDALDPNPYVGLKWFGSILAMSEKDLPVDGRFSPFRDKEQNPVPALYLAQMRETAYFETLLRPIGNAEIKTLQGKYIKDLEAVRITFEEDLKLADCRSAYLKDGIAPFWDFEHDELFEASQLKCMNNGRRLAKHIYDTYPEVDGIVWDSVQHDGCVPCFMLFGNRRKGNIEKRYGALADLSCWKPYLLRAMKNGQISLTPELAALI